MTAWLLCGASGVAVLAADIPTYSVGKPCREIRQELKARRVRNSGDDTVILAETTLVGDSVRAQYICRDMALTTEIYFYLPEKRRAALKRFQTKARSLTLQFGAPLSEPTAENAASGTQTKWPTAAWQTADRQLRLSVREPEGRTDKSLQLMLTIDPR